MKLKGYRDLIIRFGIGEDIGKWVCGITQISPVEVMPKELGFIA
jgi:hypothetical protein